MKIQQLDLIAFGPFTDNSLDLSQGNQGLHIIFGRNESGKSSSLRALRQLLYGIPISSQDGFLHAYANMRIGAKLLHTDGSVLSVVRRKGKSKTLRSAVDDSPLDDFVLERFLDGLKQPVFENMFGIAHSDLVAGGKDLCRGKGDLGQILFAAGTGAADVEGIVQRLSQEADALFLAAGSKPLINSAIAELRDAQKALKDLEVPSSDWEKHDDAVREANSKKTALETELHKMEKEISRLERIRSAVPLVSQRRELLKTAQGLDGTILLPEDFGERSRDIVLELKRANTEEQTTHAEILELNEQLAAIKVPAGILEQASVIEDLQKQLGSNQKALNDRSGLQVKLNQVEDAIKTGLKDLGHPPDLALCDKQLVTVSDRTRIRELATSKATVEAGHSNAKKILEQLNRSIILVKEELSTIADPPEVENLQKAAKRIEKMGTLETQMDAASVKLETAEVQLASDVRNLIALNEDAFGTIAENKDWEKLESVTLPSGEAIDRFEKDIETQQQVLKGLQKDLKHAERDGAGIDLQLEQFRLAMDTPTEEDLQAARDRRNTGWQLVKRAWRDGDEASPDAGKYVEEDGTGKDLAEAYEQSIDKSDHIVDRLRREADKVATKAALIAEKSKYDDRATRLKEELEASQRELEQLQKNWSQICAATSVAPLLPREMRALSLSFAATIKQYLIVKNVQIDQKSVQNTVCDYKDELSRLLIDLGEQPASSAESLAGLLERCQTVLDTVNGVKARRNLLLRDLEKKMSDKTSVEEEAQAAEDALQEWTVAWENALVPLSQDVATTPAQANAVLDTLDQMFRNVAEGQELRNRINGIDRDAKTFGVNVQKMVENVSPDIANFPPEQATSELNARLAKARASNEGLILRSAAKKKKMEALETIQGRIRECKDILDQMAEEAQCTDYELLAGAAQRSSALRETKNALAQLDNQLLRASAGLTIEEFTDEVLAIDQDMIEPSLNQLAHDVGELQPQRTELDQTIGREQGELIRINGGAQAAEAAELVQGLVAKIAAQSEQYVRTRLAIFILNRGIERYREKNQSPVLKRASEIFAQLTVGAFDGLREEYNDKGEQILVGSRSGVLVGLEGMSDGTGDQVYLALRMASLEAYLSSHEPIPFIVDDILVNFDNERSVAALKALADLSMRTQVILFTHHAHLVELAEQNIETDRLFVHGLPGVSSRAHRVSV